MRSLSSFALLELAWAIPMQNALQPQQNALPAVHNKDLLQAIANETNTDRLYELVKTSAMDTSTATAVDTQLLEGALYCFSCNNGRRASWWHRTCTCNAGWGGDCCNEIQTCTVGMTTMCPQSKLKEASAQCTAVTGTGPLMPGTAAMNLPTSMQGIFWLTKQGDSSSLMTFGTSRDGAGLDQIQLNPADGVHIKVRVGGDKTWSFSDKGKSWWLIEYLDLIYEFSFEGADGKAPANLEQATAAQIIPYAANLGFRLSWTDLLDFRMNLLTNDKKTKYTNSVVWGRPSRVLNNVAESAYYELVQIIDGAGNPLEPAYSDWVTFCKDEGAVKVTGSTPGQIWYHEVV